MEDTKKMKLVKLGKKKIGRHRLLLHILKTNTVTLCGHRVSIRKNNVQISEGYPEDVECACCINMLYNNGKYFFRD
jgi:hypothetical protein